MEQDLLSKKKPGVYELMGYKGFSPLCDGKCVEGDQFLQVVYFYMCEKYMSRIIEKLLPFDVCTIIHEFLPCKPVELCYICGMCLVAFDKRGRLHVWPQTICTESVCMCSECFELFYL